jgi:hypothetical protein
MHPYHLNFSYRFAARDPRHDVYPGKSRGEGGLPMEGFEKMVWLHHNHGIPCTVMVDSVAITLAKRRLLSFLRFPGNEIVLSLEAFAAQPMWKKFGVEQRAFGLRSYSREELLKLFTGLRRFVADELGVEVKIGAGYWYSPEVIQAAEESGLDALWGLCWDQQGIDGATHRGSPWFPYYASPKEFRCPNPGERGLLLLPWYGSDLGNACLFGHHPPFSTHMGEITRWNLEYPADYMKAILAAYAKTKAPFSHMQFHLELDWFDSSGIFNDEDLSPATEVWRLQMACVAAVKTWNKWKVGTLSEFVDWHRKEFSRTTTHVQHWKDPFGNFPDLIFKAGPEEFTIADASGKLLASQSYKDGLLGETSSLFMDRALFLKRFGTPKKLPGSLERCLKVPFGLEHDTIGFKAMA